MRIGLNTPDPQATSTEKTKKSGSVSSTSASRVHGKHTAEADTVTLSALASKAMENPEVRQEKVDALRQGVSSGEYQPDSNQSAEAMLSH